MAETTIMNYEELSYKKEGKKYTVIARLNLREEPSLDSNVIRILEKGEKITAYVDGEWAVLEEGYCKAEFLE